MKLLSIVRSDQPAPPMARLALPVASVMMASMLALLPIIATAPIIPSFGLLMILAWRLLRADLIAPWAGIPLGLFDDLFSGAPIGTAVATWTMALLTIEAVDRRWLFRDIWADWAIAAALIAGQMLAALVLGTATGAVPSPILLLPQWLAAVLCFPLAARIAAWLDRRRTSGRVGS